MNKENSSAQAFRPQVALYKPKLEDLWFRRMFMADPETMSYNDAWGGAIDFPPKAWEEWFDRWVRNPKERFSLRR